MIRNVSIPGYQVSRVRSMSHMVYRFRGYKRVGGYLPDNYQVRGYLTDIADEARDRHGVERQYL
jgi:hypothetical protein